MEELGLRFLRNSKNHGRLPAWAPSGRRIQGGTDALIWLSFPLKACFTLWENYKLIHVELASLHFI